MQKNASGGQGLFVFLRAGAETPALWSAGRRLRPALLRARPLVGGAAPSPRAPLHPCLRSAGRCLRMQTSAAGRCLRMQTSAAGRCLRPALLRTRAFVRRGGASVCRLPRQGGTFAPRSFVPALWSAGRCLRPALLRTRAFARRGGAFVPRSFVPALWSAGRRGEGSGRCGFCNINTKNKKFFQDKY